MVGSCPACGTPRTPGALFCGMCGNRVDDERASAGPWSTGAPPPPPPPGIAVPTGTPFGAEPVSTNGGRAVAATARHIPRGLTIAVQIVAGVLVLACAWAAISNVIAWSRADAFERDGAVAFDAWADADDTAIAIGNASLLLTVGLVVLLIVWLALATRAVGRHRVSGRSFGTGWAIGGWFVPIANLVLPALVFRETERIATAAAAGRPATWGLTRYPLRNLLWWVLVILGRVVLTVAANIRPSEGLAVDDYRVSYVVSVVGLALLSLGALLLVFAVGRITRLDHAT